MRLLSDARVFRYGLSRAGWTMLALLLGMFVVLWAQYVITDLSAPDSESMMALGLIMLVFTGILAPVPVMEMIWWARGRVLVDAEGIRWRGWGAWNERAWGEILGVGMPPGDAKRQDDERIHVVTEESYEFIHGFGLRGREALRDAIRSYGDLDQVEVIGKHTFLCRPGAVETVKQRAEGHVDLDTEEYDFWASRFRRF